MGLLLLDVNALLALGWPNHQFHDSIVARLEKRPHARWASCALTQLGFVRLSCNRAAVGMEKTAVQASELLSEWVRDPKHVFLERMPAVSKGSFGRILGHQQVTDAYLVALAQHHKATLLTFDRRLTAVTAAKGLVETLPGSL